MTNKFQDWLNEQMRRYGWDPIELAITAKISSSTISRITKGDRQPGLQTCLKLSKAFNLPIETVLRAAGYSTNNTFASNETDKTIELIKQLTKEERGIIDRICRGFILTRNR